MPAIDSVLDADFDIFSPEAIKDPQRYDALIREAAPVVYFPKYDVWATGRHDQIELRLAASRSSITNIVCSGHLPALTNSS